MASDRDYLKSICSVGRAFAGSLNKKEILGRIIDAAIETLHAKAACLFLDDPEQGIFVPTAQKGLSDGYLHAAPHKARDLVLKDLAGKGFIAIENAAEDDRVENRQGKKDEGIASILVVPVTANAAPIGVLSLYTAEPRKFTDDEIAFLTLLAQMGGIALDRARLIDHIRKNSTLFYELSAGINASLDFKQILTTLTRDLGQSFKARGVSVMLLDESGKTLTTVATDGIDDVLFSEEALAKDQVIAKTLTGETILIPDVATTRDIFDPKAFEKQKITGILSVPIKSGSLVSGVLHLYFGAPKNFYPDEIMMINAFALQAGLAIQNTACFVSLENEHKDLKDDIWSHRSWF